MQELALGGLARNKSIKHARRPCLLLFCHLVGASRLLRTRSGVAFDTSFPPLRGVRLGVESPLPLPFAAGVAGTLGSSFFFFFFFFFFLVAGAAGTLGSVSAGAAFGSAPLGSFVLGPRS